MSKRWAGCLLAIFLATVHGRAGENEAPFFPIVAWGLHPTATEAFFRDMADCGITVAGFAAPKQLDMIHAAGMKAYVYGYKQCSDMNWMDLEPDAKEKFAFLSKHYNDHPAVLGYFLVDEPSSPSFPGIRKMADMVGELAPGRERYVDLLPNYATPKQLGAESYRAYVERFVEECRPDALVFNFYPLYENTDALRKGYWENLALVREVALKRNLPFRVCVGSVAHFKHPVQTRETLMFQVCAALAHGAKGIEYYRFWDGYTGNYRMAPLDAFGGKTAIYDAMRYVNRYVATNWASVLLALDSTRVYHLPGGQEPGAPGPDAESLVSGCPGGPFLVGEFAHRETGEIHVMIVNANLRDSQPIDTLTFRRKPTKIQTVSPFSPDQLRSFAGEEQWLAPGQGKLLKITP